MGRLLYFAEQALDSIRGAPGMSLLTSGTIAAALVVLGTYVMALQNLEQVALLWGRSSLVIGYIDDKLDEAKWEGVRKQLESLDAVQTALLQTPKQALDNFKSRGPQAEALVQGVAEDLLPASVHMSLHAGFADLAKVETVSQEVAATPGIVDVDYGREEFDRLAALLDLLRAGGAIAGLLMALATALIVSNVVRLAVYARREEIAILRLVGGTAWFIRTPFLMEGACWGLAGGVLGTLALFAADRFAAPRISAAVDEILGGLQVRLFGIELGFGLVVAGVVLGALGSALAVRRFLEEDESV